MFLQYNWLGCEYSSLSRCCAARMQHLASLNIQIRRRQQMNLVVTINVKLSMRQQRSNGKFSTWKKVREADRNGRHVTRGRVENGIQRGLKGGWS